ncbi:[similarity to] bacteriophage related protein, partial [methanotrophic bacterial endosymbiont of Bathymodiolus sp.]
MDEIKSLWRQLYRKDPPTHIRSFLEKRLAYRLQEVEFRRTHQNLADKNDRRIQAIVNTGKKPLRDRYPQPI